MYRAIPTQPSCARAWVAAASAIASDGEAYNVVIDVEHPTMGRFAGSAVVFGFSDRVASRGQPLFWSLRGVSRCFWFFGPGRARFAGSAVVFGFSDLAVPRRFAGSAVIFGFSDLAVPRSG
jgi:hypothetical protein